VAIVEVEAEVQNEYYTFTYESGALGYW